MNYWTQCTLLRLTDETKTVLALNSCIFWRKNRNI